MIKYVNADAASRHNALVQSAYRQIKRDFGFLAEPFSLHTPSPEILAGAWMLVRETLVTGAIEREVKEAVATAVSEANRCPYCIDAHEMMFQASGGSDPAKLRNHPNPLVRQAYDWGLATRTWSAEAKTQPPFPPGQAQEILGTALAFHYVNRMVSVFLDETPLPVRHAWFKGIQETLAALWLRASVRRPKLPGQSFELLPESNAAVDLAWLDSGSIPARAIQTWAGTLERNGGRVLTPIARSRILAHLQTWRGEDPPLGFAWMDRATHELEGEDLAGVRFGLMVALCPYRVTRQIIDEYRAYQKTDKSVIEAAAWASMQAALRIASGW